MTFSPATSTSIPRDNGRQRRHDAVAAVPHWDSNAAAALVQMLVSPTERQQPFQPPLRCWRGVSVAEAMNPARRSTMEDVCVVHGVGEWGQPSGKAAASSAAPLVQARNHHDDDNQRRFKEEEDCDCDCLSNMAYIGIYDGHGGKICLCLCVDSDRIFVCEKVTHESAISHAQMCFFPGREMVDFLRHALEYHVARELRAAASASAVIAPTSTAPSTTTRRRLALENAFLLADIHAQAVGIHSSGATVAVCLIQVRTV
jgi:hypothetical protein